METKIMIYEGNEIEFSLDRDNKMMVNATEMAKAFDKQVNHFMSTDSTRNFIDSCLNSRKNGNIRFITENDLVVSSQKSGTWMHRILALKFAAWLNSDFEVWVYSVIEDLLFDRHIKREQSFSRTIALQKEMEILRYKINKTGEDFERFLTIEQTLRREAAVRRSLTISTIEGIEQVTLFQ